VILSGDLSRTQCDSMDVQCSPAPVMTRVKRMSCRAEVHEYWGVRNWENEGVYIVASHTDYPPNCLTGLYALRGKCYTLFGMSSD
jgi:hypothetical protein